MSNRRIIIEESTKIGTVSIEDDDRLLAGGVVLYIGGTSVLAYFWPNELMIINEITKLFHTCIIP